MDIKMDIEFCAIWIESDPYSRTHSYKCTYSEKTGLTTKERVWSHYVCIGDENCMICGRALPHPEPEPRNKWWQIWE